MSGLKQPIVAEVAVDGEVLRIRVVHRRKFGFFRGSLSLSLVLPERAYAALQAAVPNGAFSAGQLEVGELRVRQGNGGARGESVQADRISMETANGNLEPRHVAGTLAARTRN